MGLLCSQNQPPLQAVFLYLSLLALALALAFPLGLFCEGSSSASPAFTFLRFGLTASTFGGSTRSPVTGASFGGSVFTGFAGFDGRDSRVDGVVALIFLGLL